MCSLGDLNPCSRRERAVSWATRRRRKCGFKRQAGIIGKKSVNYNGIDCELMIEFRFLGLEGEYFDL